MFLSRTSTPVFMDSSGNMWTRSNPIDRAGGFQRRGAWPPVLVPQALERQRQVRAERRRLCRLVERVAQRVQRAAQRTERGIQGAGVQPVGDVVDPLQALLEIKLEIVHSGFHGHL